LAALVANFIIAIAKFVAYSFTLSSSMLAEGFHSVADTGNQLLMLLGVKRAAKPADEDHPYGYGKETYFWSFVVALSIFALGAAFAFYEGIHKLIEHLHEGPKAIPNQTVGFIVLGVSLVVEGASLLVAAKEFRRSMGDMSFREALHETRAAAIVTVLFEDAAACLGLAIALLGITVTVLTGNPLFDIIATLLIGVLLAVVAFFLGFMTKKLLIGQSAGPQARRRIMEAIGEMSQIDAVVGAKTLHMGSDVILLNLEIDFADELTTNELERVIDTIETRVKAAVPEVKYIYIEAEGLKKVGRGRSGEVSVAPESAEPAKPATEEPHREGDDG
jgi:cation diffusion facilitator family transporter